jgi:uncharacterized protein (TIGR00661 family)
MRARTIASHLASRGHDVKIAASGRAVGILRGHGFDVAAIDGMTMRYEAGAVRRARTVAGLLRQAPGAIRRNARAALALDFVPDAVITDFDSFAHAVGKILDVPIISVDHQHVFDRFHHPPRVVSRLSSNRPVRAFVSAKTARCDAYVVTSFFFPRERERNTTPTFLVGPIVRPELERITPSLGDHVLVYQTTAGDPRLVDALRGSRGRFVVYGLGRSETLGNVELRKFDETAFLRDLASARAVIANGGFTAISESVYLGKPILSVPVRGQPEQELNAAWVDELGVGTSAPFIGARVVEEFLARAPSFRTMHDARIRTGTRDACDAVCRALEGRRAA